MKRIDCFRRLFFLTALWAATGLCSCAGPKQLTIYSEPARAAIYVDDVFVGNGIAEHTLVKGQEYVEISCSVDGVEFARRRFFVRSMPSVATMQAPREFQRYSSDYNSISVH
ncbi:hypothetical protein [Alistipes communis]|uniref:hypothetical protein n=1 Tax=Alistipes communis TaxID=2585118 RepID=UPI001D091C38|nr:hypothetical protein [Alistipes communis]